MGYNSSDKIINIHDAKTHLSAILEQVLNGENIVIAKSNIPKIRLIPYVVEKKPPRKGGGWKGLIKIPKNFDDPLPLEVLKGFYGDDFDGE